MAKVIVELMEASLKEQLESVKDTFDKWVFRSIDSCYEATQVADKGTPLACYILLSCAIDALAGFYVGRNSFKPGSIGEDYKLFVERFMPEFNPKELYVYIRCALTHNYMIDGNFGLTHNHPELHNAPTNNTPFSKIVNFDNLYTAVKAAAAKYFEEVEHSTDLQFRFKRRFSKGFARLFTVNIPPAEFDSTAQA